MSWQQRDWYLGEHAPRLFDTDGNVGPTLWWDGRIVGGWAQARDGQIVCRFLEDVGADAVAAADAAAGPGRHPGRRSGSPPGPGA